MRRPNRHSLALLLISSALTMALASAASEVGQPRLDRPDELEDLHSYRATGTDPDGPRSLVLWRWDGARFIRIASTRSDASGRFDFGEQPLPSNEAFYHVSLRNEKANPNRLLRIERPLPAPVVISAAPGGGEIILTPAHQGGEIRIYDADSGRLILRRPIETMARPGMSIDFTAELQPPWPSALSIEQVLDDGRRSKRQYWPLD